MNQEGKKLLTLSRDIALNLLSGCWAVMRSIPNLVTSNQQVLVMPIDQ